MGTTLWILLVLLALCLKHRSCGDRFRRVLVLMPGLSLFLTLFIAAPVAEFRYAYPVICAMPLFIAHVLSLNNDEITAL
jgi:hypothetical protein